MASVSAWTFIWAFLNNFARSAFTAPGLLGFLDIKAIHSVHNALNYDLLNSRMPCKALGTVWSHTYHPRYWTLYTHKFSEPMLEVIVKRNSRDLNCVRDIHFIRIGKVKHDEVVPIFISKTLIYYILCPPISLWGAPKKGSHHYCTTPVSLATIDLILFYHLTKVAAVYSTYVMRPSFQGLVWLKVYVQYQQIGDWVIRFMISSPFTWVVDGLVRVFNLTYVIGRPLEMSLVHFGHRNDSYKCVSLSEKSRQ